MKILVGSTYAIFMFSILFSSCKKETEETTTTTTNTTTTTTTSITSGSEEFHVKSSSSDFVISKVKGTLKTKAFKFEGTGTNSEEVEMSLDTIAGIVGTYTLTTNDFSNYVNITVGGQQYISYGTNAGSIKITSIDRKNQIIKGTFSLKLMNSSTQALVTFNAAFNVYYAASSSFSCKINGVLRTYTGSLSVSSSIATLKGDAGMWETIYINLDPSVTAGTYAFVTSGKPNAAYNKTLGDYYDGTSGTITITSYDKINKSIKGTFSFNGLSNNSSTTVAITEGKFDIQ